MFEYLKAYFQSQKKQRLSRAKERKEKESSKVRVTSRGHGRGRCPSGKYTGPRGLYKYWFGTFSPVQPMPTPVGETPKSAYPKKLHGIIYTNKAERRKIKRDFVKVLAEDRA